MNLSDDTRAAILAHAKAEHPRECCGVLQVVKGRQVYTPCRNLAERPGAHFVLAPADWAAAEDRGEVLAVVHSHCNLPPTPSQADRVACAASGLPWLIAAWPAGGIETLLPAGYEAPLVGRQFCHGVLDCYALIRDYYARELRIALPDYDRRDRWWERGENLYMDFYRGAGFVPITPITGLARHDMIVMQLGSPVPNHGAVYLGENVVLHHVENRLSSRDVYGGFWRKHTVAVFRHRALLP